MREILQELKFSITCIADPDDRDDRSGQDGAWKQPVFVPLAFMFKLLNDYYI